MSRVVIIGGTGFIGRHLTAALREAGHAVSAAGRDRIDLAADGEAVIQAGIAGHDVVINAAGLARDGRGQSMQAVHRDGAAKLIAACRASGVRRLIQISALGAAATGQTGYQRSKGEAEALFAEASDIACCVLRPSLVIGRGGASTALFCAIAALPRPLRLGPGTWRVQPVHVEDLAALVVRLVADDVVWPERIDVVGPEPMSTDAVTAALRDWLGLRPTWFLPVPEPLLPIAAMVGERLGIGAINRELLVMLKDGNVASASPLAAALGRAPRSLAQALARCPASAADRLAARLTIVRPLVRWSLGLLWVITGLLSLGLYPLEGSYRLLDLVGLHEDFARIALFGGAALDLMIGLLLLVGWRPVVLGAAMLASMLMFSLIATRLPAAYWLDPLAPLLKNLPLAAATLAMMAMEG
jgi:uncharacterized protein YbjT (DUF2867 family)